MSGLEKFSLVTGIVGLIVDTITLFGIASVQSVSKLDNEYWGNLEFTVIWTFSLMIYGLIICLFFTIQFAKNRWANLGKYPDTISKKYAILSIGYLFWLPLSIVWGIIINKMLGEKLYISSNQLNIIPELCFLYFIVVVPGGGFVLTQIAIFLNNFFNPEINKQENSL